MEGEILEGQIILEDFLFGRMCQEHSVAPEQKTEKTTKERTSKQSSQKSSKSQNQMLPMFLYLKTEDGQSQDALWVSETTDNRFPLLTDYMTHSFGECPREEKESRLSQILEDSPHPKYCLSAKACQGILRRAEQRGKELPPILKEALIRQSVSKNEQGNLGGGKGILIQNERTGALSTLNNQSVCYGLCFYDSNSMKSSNPHSGIYEADTSRTLDLNGGNPACNQGGMIVLEGNGQRESHKGDGYKESDVMYTLNTVEQHAVCIENHPADSRVKISEDGVVQTLSSRMGTGGGNVPMVMEQPITASKASFFMNTNNDGKAETLVAIDYKDPQIVCNSVVRRLTPLECERLQGFPDGWTDIGEWIDTKGKTHKDADSPRYKALGNSIALPFWRWMARRMVVVLKADGVENPTMAGLFDGISGFPLAYKNCGCEPIWASEIEEFPIAVAKKHFGNGEQKGDVEEYLKEEQQWHGLKGY